MEKKKVSSMQMKKSSIIILKILWKKLVQKFNYTNYYSHPKMICKFVLAWTLLKIVTGQEESTKRLIMIGQTGSGKSTLGNTLLATDKFKVCHDIDSCTAKVQIEKGFLFGKNDTSSTGIPVTVSDTGGLGDTEDRDEDFVDDVASHMRFVGGFHGILFVFNACDTRLHAQARSALKTLVNTLTSNDNKYQIAPRLSIVMTQCTLSPKRLLWENLPTKLCELLELCDVPLHWYDDYGSINLSAVRSMMGIKASWKDEFTEWVQKLPQTPMDVPSESERENLKREYRENTEQEEEKLKKLEEQIEKLQGELDSRQNLQEIMQEGQIEKYQGELDSRQHLQEIMQRMEVEIKELKEEARSAKNSMTGGCFSATSQVVERHLGNIAIRDLKIGYEVATDSGWATVSTFLHWHPTDTLPAIQILHAQGNLTLTPLHLLFTIDGGGNTHAIPANQLQSGDLLLTTDQVSVVLDVKAITMQGYFAPVTSSGTILVDNVVASCYMHDGHYNLPHWVLNLLAAPLRMIPQWLSYMPAAGRVHPFLYLLGALQ